MIALLSGAFPWAVLQAHVAKIRRGATLRKVTIAILAGLALLFGGAMPAWAEATTETKSAADCAAYAESEAWCDPAVADYNCPDIDNSHKPIILLGAADPFDLDKNGDGQGCEGDVPGGGDAGGAPPEEPPAEEPPAENPGACAHYADSAAWCSDTHGDYDCPDIDDAHKPIELFDAEKDPFHLDRDSDALGCEVGEDDSGSTDDGSGAGDDDAGDDDAGDVGGAAGTGGDGEALPNTGSGALGPLWLAVLAFLAAGALLVTRRAVGQR